MRVDRTNRMRVVTAVICCLLIGVGCGGGGGDGSSDGEAQGEQAGGALALGSDGQYVNTCSVLTDEEVAEATGLTVTGHEERRGCDWLVERVDENVVENDSIRWQPQQAEQFEAQRQSAPQVDSDIVIEPLDGIGNDAFWQGSEGSPLGEVWVLLDDLSFRVTNQFGTFDYKDSRPHQEGLARALAEALG